MKNTFNSKRQVSKRRLAIVLFGFLIYATSGFAEETETTTTQSPPTESPPSTTAPSAQEAEILPTPKLSPPKIKVKPVKETPTELQKPVLKKPKAIALENLDCSQLAKTVRDRAFRCLDEVTQKQRALCCAEMNDYFGEQQEGIAVCQPQIKIVHKELLDAEKKKYSKQNSGCE